MGRVYIMLSEGITPDKISSELSFASSISDVFDVLGEIKPFSYIDYRKSDFRKGNSEKKTYEYRWDYREGNRRIMIWFYANDNGEIVDYVEVGVFYD